MPLQQFAILFFEGSGSMVFPLMTDIPDNTRQQRRAHRKGSVAILPMEIPCDLPAIIDPFRGRRFEDLNQLGKIHRLGWFHDRMDMILNAPNLNRMDTMIAGNASNVGPKTFLPVGMYHHVPMLRAPDTMQNNPDITVGHAVKLEEPIPGTRPAIDSF